jgi:hypothetical protein
MAGSSNPDAPRAVPRRKQRIEDRKQRMENRGQKTENRGRKSEIRICPLTYIAPAKLRLGIYYLRK